MGFLKCLTQIDSCLSDPEKSVCLYGKYYRFYLKWSIRHAYGKSSMWMYKTNKAYYLAKVNRKSILMKLCDTIPIIAATGLL